MPQPVVFDEKDQQLLLSLIKDCRTPTSTLSSEIELSVAATLERIAKLEQNIIKHYKLALNHKAFPFEEYDIYYQLTNVSEFTIENAMKHLKDCRYTTQVIATMGWCDLRITILARNTQHLEEILTNMERNFSANIKSRVILAVTKKYKSKAESFLSAIFGKHIARQTNLTQVYKERTEELDAIDKQIIRMLSEDPRTSYVDIAKKVKRTPEAISARVKNLEKRQVIWGYTTLLDGAKLGYQWAVLLINSRYPSEQNRKEILDYVQEHGFASSAVETLGAFTMSITLFGKTLQDIRETELAFRSKFGENCTDTALVFLLENEKYPDLASGILE